MMCPSWQGLPDRPSLVVGDGERHVWQRGAQGVCEEAGAGEKERPIVGLLKGRASGDVEWDEL